MNARQYFYKNVQPKFVGMSYQKAMNIKFSEKDRITTKILRHIPKFSNDPHLEYVIKDLLTYHIPQTFRDRLEHMFVAKLKNYEYSAAALEKPGEYRGDLIYFYVGLSDCLLQFCIYHTEFADKKTDNSLLEQHGLKLTMMSQDWRENYPLVIALDRNFVIDSSDDELIGRAVGISTLTDKFVICHEIAHHLLGHTGKNNDAYFLLDKLPQELKTWVNKPIHHARELQADALAALFMMKLTDTTMIQGALGESQDAFEAILGCLLVMSVNVFLSNDPAEATSTHPSDNERLESSFAILSHFTSLKLSEWVNAKLVIMFGYLKMLDEFTDLIDNGASKGETEAILRKLKILLRVRNGLKQQNY